MLPDSSMNERESGYWTGFATIGHGENVQGASVSTTAPTSAIRDRIPRGNFENLAVWRTVIDRNGIASAMHENFGVTDGRFPQSREVFRNIPNVNDGAIRDETFLIFPIRSPS